MQIWQAIILGFTQGLTEFLPVSSSGHLTLMQKLLGVSEENYMFLNVMLHVGTLIPVIVVFFKEILQLFKKPFNKMLYLIVATIPAVIVGLFLDDYIDMAFRSEWFLIVGFFLTACILFFAEKASKKQPLYTEVNLKTAGFMGLAQAVATLPAISRSGSTIAMGCFTQLDREKNANFAFLMSIPVILGAGLIEGYHAVTTGITIELLPLIFGVLSAMISGYLAIKLMLAVVKKANYKWFSLYLIILSVTLCILKLCGVF